MRDCLGSGTILGYCTNVHAGATFEQTLANLQKHAVKVRERVSPTEPMGVGLWLSAVAARQVLDQDRSIELREWLRSRGLLPFTLNGFPHGDFHQPVVKFRVYSPDWSEDRRLAYTIDLADILSCLLPEGAEGSISTLPVGWGGDFRGAPDKLRAAGNHLRSLAAHLAQIEAERGRLIHVDLEPEPGCQLTTSQDLVEFFEQYLLSAGHEEIIRRHLRVCHDVCHTVVMFEDQAGALERYRRAGIEIGKVQLSSAIRANFNAFDEEQQTACLGQLGSFAEDRYLHQTVIQPASSGPRLFVDDLPKALEMAASDPALLGEWRVHFHAPLYLQRFGLVETTQQTVVDCLAIIRDFSDVRHFEAETYAWSVLPAELQVDELAAGIADELRWVRQQAATLSSA
jgi:sugar phosphate isomerase/epimerase